MKRIFKLLAVLSVVMLSGCAMFESTTGGQMTERFDGPAVAPIDKHVWIKVKDSTELMKYCPFTAPTSGACVQRKYFAEGGPVCHIYSDLEEWEAKRAATTNILGTPLMSLWEHEVVMHCYRGLNHPIEERKHA